MYVSQLLLVSQGWPGGYVGFVLEPELVPGLVPLDPPLVPDDEVEVPGALPVPPEHAGAAVAKRPNIATQVNGSRAIATDDSAQPTPGKTD